MIEAAARLQLPFVKLPELVREWVRSFDFRNPDKFLLSDQELQMIAHAADGPGRTLAPAEARPCRCRRLRHQLARWWQAQAHRL